MQLTCVNSDRLWWNWINSSNVLLGHLNSQSSASDWRDSQQQNILHDNSIPGNILRITDPSPHTFIFTELLKLHTSVCQRFKTPWFTVTLKYISDTVFAIAGSDNGLFCWHRPNHNLESIDIGSGNGWASNYLGSVDRDLRHAPMCWNIRKVLPAKRLKGVFKLDTCF